MSYYRGYGRMRNGITGIEAEWLNRKQKALTTMISRAKEEFDLWSDPV